MIALFYTDGPRPRGGSLVAVGARSSLIVVEATGRDSYHPCSTWSAAWWPCGSRCFESGVHATIAGVALGFLTPARPFYNSDEFEAEARDILDTYPLGDSLEDDEKSTTRPSCCRRSQRSRLPPSTGWRIGCSHGRPF